MAPRNAAPPSERRYEVFETTEASGEVGLTLEELDRDGAILEAIDNVYRDSRAGLLGKAVIGGSALLAALAESPPAAGKTGDVAMLNYDLTLEYLQASFYTVAERIGTVRDMRPERGYWARIVGAHERGHVKILRKVLGTKAVKSPFFDFGKVVEDGTLLIKTGVALEDLTCALLAGQAERFDNPELVSAIFSLLTTEARHAAWARRMVGAQPFERPLDDVKSMRDVSRIIKSTRFIARRPKVTARRQRPRFTG
jgi:Ferritin-like domain